MHLPQSVEAATELREIAAVPLQIVSPRESTPIVSVVQDTLVGANRFTRPDILFTRREAMNLLVHAKRWNGVMPEPVIHDPVPKWSGQQLLSALLPPVTLEMPNSSFGDEDRNNPNSQNLVKIANGNILQGILDKSVFSKQLLHIIYNDYGPELTVDFLDSLQAMIANFLMNSGFSVGISDLIADEATNQEIGTALKKLTTAIEEQILQLHTGLFENSSGRSNQEEFESKVMGTLNKATGEAGKIGLKSLAANNRMTNMVKAGSKGSDTNVSQMIAALGQQAIEGKRVPNGFQHRTLPHFKRFDDSAQARGFIKSSFIKGLNPDEFFFHAMAGREGLIDTAVKSVTADTEIVVLENGAPKWTQIGPWIDGLLDAAPEKVEHMETANQELLNLEHPVFIPTGDAAGKMTWGQMTAVTRHDPGECLYAVKTESGREVTVAKSQSLLVWDEETMQFLAKASPDVKVGDLLPACMQMPEPPTLLTHVDVSQYLPKTEDDRLPTQFELNEQFGIFVGLYLADQTSNNEQSIRRFIVDWHKDAGLECDSKPLGQFLEKFLGSGSANKFVPNEAFAAPKEFLRGLLNGYFSGDGSVGESDISASSASKRLSDGIASLLTRFGIFSKAHVSYTQTNNVGTEKILPAYRLAIRSHWAAKFAKEIPMLHEAKQIRLNALRTTDEHRNFAYVNDSVKDRVVEIAPISTLGHPKLYDVTVPSTFNFLLFNGTNVRDTADTGYAQRQIRVALEDLITHHDGSVRDLQGNLLQVRYGEDGINATKLENQSLPLATLSDDDIRAKCATEGDSREEAYVANMMEDRRFVVEQVFSRKMGKGVKYPVHLERIRHTIQHAFKLYDRDNETGRGLPLVTGGEVLDAHETILARTHKDNRLWGALVRFHLAPVTLQSLQYTKPALDALVEEVVLTHLRSWVEPGQPVGVIAAQSIGEPATQLTLNSVDWDQRIVIAKNGRILTTEIGKFIDDYFESVKTIPGKVQYLENNQIYIPLDDGNDWKAISCDENGCMKWTTLEAVTRHPVVNDDGTNTILEVCLESGRKVKATKAHSFLTYQDGKILSTQGSLLKIGDKVPVSMSLALDSLQSHDAYVPECLSTLEHSGERVRDVALDRIVSITDVTPISEWVYDLTVEETRNFMLENRIVVRDTFHLSGVAAKSNVTRGVPRLKELLKATRNPKAVELTIPLRADLRNKKEEARRVAHELEFTLLQDLVTTARIYYDPRDDATLIAEDADWLAYMIAYERAGQTDAAPVPQPADPLSAPATAQPAAPPQPTKSPWILRFELDRERMFAKNITMDDIAFILRSKFSELETVYTDYNAQNLVFRLRLDGKNNPLDDLTMLKTLQNKVLTATAIRGIPGLRAVNYQKVSDMLEFRADEGKYAPVDQYILMTDGSNFLDVLCHPDVDPTRVISSNVHDMYENLGIEATRAILYKEIFNVFEESGTTVNHRHVSVLVDKICSRGKLMSVDRYGINKSDIGPLAKMSFEQTEDIALRSALFGERDPVVGMSANVMLGAPIRAGTAFTEILLDEAAAIELARTTPEQTAVTTTPTRLPVMLREKDIENVLYAEETGDCAPAVLKMEAVLPASTVHPIMEEEEDVEITFLTEE